MLDNAARGNGRRTPGSVPASAVSPSFHTHSNMGANRPVQVGVLNKTGAAISESISAPAYSWGSLTSAQSPGLGESLCLARWPDVRIMPPSVCHSTADRIQLLISRGDAAGPQVFWPPPRSRAVSRSFRHVLQTAFPNAEDRYHAQMAPGGDARTVRATAAGMNLLPLIFEAAAGSAPSPGAAAGARDSSPHPCCC